MKQRIANKLPYKYKTTIKNSKHTLNQKKSKLLVSLLFSSVQPYPSQESRDRGGGEKFNFMKRFLRGVSRRVC